MKEAFTIAYGGSNFLAPTGKSAGLKDTFSWLGTLTYSLLPVHTYRGYQQCKVRIGIPLEKKGGHWRMAYRNVNDTFLGPEDKRRASWMGLHRRPFASRAAALKYARRLWPGTKVQLASYGLEVTIYRPDPHLIRAVNDRTARAAGRRSNFASTYSRPLRNDHADAVIGAFTALALYGNHYQVLPPITVTDPG